MNELGRLQKLLDDSKITHFMVADGVFLCGDARDTYARIASYVLDESRFQVTLEGLTPEQVVAALSATLKEEAE